MAEEQRGITITFRGDTASFDYSIDNINKALRLTQAETKSLNNALQLNPKSVDLVNDKISNLKQSIYLAEEAISHYKKQLQGVIAPSEELAKSSEFQKLVADLDAAKQEASKLTEQMALAKANKMDVTDPEGWNKLTDSLKKASSNATELEDKYNQMVMSSHQVTDVAQYDNYQRKLIRLTGDVASFNSQLNKANQRLAELKGTDPFFQLQQEIAGVNAEAKSINEALKFDPSNISLLEQKAANLKQSIELTNKELDHYSKLAEEKKTSDPLGWESAKNAMENAKAKLIQYNGQLNQTNAEIEKLKGQNLEFNLKKQLSNLKSEAQGLNSVLRQSPDNIDAMEKKAANLSSTVDLLKQQISFYSDEIKKTDAPSDEMISNLRTAETELQVYEQELAKTSQRLKELKGQDVEYNLKKQLSNLKNEAKGLNNVLRDSPDNLDALEKKADNLSNTISVLEKQMSLYGEEVKKTDSPSDELVANLQSVESELQVYKTDLAQTTQRIRELKGEDLSYELNKQSEALKKTSQTLNNVSNDLRYVSLAAGGALVGAIKSASDFESAWVGVEKVVNETSTTSYDMLQEQVKELARNIPVDLNTITEAFANAGQLGVNADNLQEFVETILRLDSATNLSADEAATTIAQLYNVMGADLSTVDNFANALVRLGNTSATTEKDILEMASTIGASAKQVGFTESQVLGLADALSAAGLNPSSAGTAISQFLTKIDKSLAKSSDAWSKYNKKTKKNVTTALGTQMRELARLAGITGKGDEGILANFQKAWNADSAQVFERIIAGMSEAVGRGENLNVIFEKLGINGIKQDSTLKALANSYPLLADAMESANDAFENGNDAVKESDKAWETFSSKVETLKNNLKLLGISLGNTILPVISDLVEKVTDIVKWFDGLSPTAKKVITFILGIVAAISPVLKIASKVLGIFSTIKKFVAGIVAKGAVTKMMGFFPKLVGFLGKIGSWFAKLGPWGVVLGGIIGLIIAFKDEFDTLMYALLGSETWDAIKKVVQDVADFIGKAFDFILGGIGDILGKLGEGFKWIWEQIEKIAIARGMTPKGQVGIGRKDLYNAVAVEGQGVGRLTIPVIHSGGLGLAMAGGTNITLSTSINVSNNGTPIDEMEVRRWGNVITDIVSDNLGRRW